MTRKSISIFLMVLVSTALLILGSCGMGTNDGEGTLELNLTDAPIAGSDVEGVFITITKIEYNAGSDEESQFVEFTDYVQPDEPFNLLDLTNGIAAALGELTLPAGEYGQLRFYVDATEEGSGAPASPGCYVTLVGDDTIYPLFVPSGAQSGYKANVDTGHFTVPVNGTVIVTADFDVSKSLTRRGGAQNSFILRPTVRLVVDAEAGEIGGKITYDGTGQLVVYAYETGTFDAQVDLVSDSTKPGFPGAVTSSIVKSDDTTGDLIYTIAFLAAGTYDLYVAEYRADGTLIDTAEADLTVETDIVVGAGVETLKDLTVTAATAETL